MVDRLAGMSVAAIRRLARVDARNALEAYWPSGRLPVNPVFIARALGASVYSADLAADTWGTLVGTAGGAVIYLDRSQPKNRYRFSCAHEVGHLVSRGTDIAEGKAFIDKRSDENRGTADEIYANEFAAALLMPEEQLKAAIDAGEDEFELVQRFGVSIDALSYHRLQLGI